MRIGMIAVMAVCWFVVLVAIWRWVDNEPDAWPLEKETRDEF